MKPVAFNKKLVFQIFWAIISLVLIVDIGMRVKNLQDYEKTLDQEEKIALDEKGKGAGFLFPSELTIAKTKYNNQPIELRAKVSTAPIVCQKKECASNDSCCGCPDTRDLIASDFRASLSSSGPVDLLKLRDVNNQPICQRKTNSCNYDCQGWENGSIYDMSGTFVFEQGPAGWNRPKDLYVKVSDKSLIRFLGMQESFGQIFEKIGSIFSGFKGDSGTYVLP
jgi:hypothetical protein